MEWRRNGPRGYPRSFVRQELFSSPREDHLPARQRAVALPRAFCEEAAVQEAAPAPATNAPAPAASGAAPALPTPSAARTAGRGGLAIAFAKVSFILFGFVQQLLLERLLGQAGYGQISRVLAIVGVLNNVVVSTALQGVSRAVSTASAGEEGAVFARTLRVHVVLAVVLSLGFALAAGTIAAAVGAPHVATPLRLVAAVVLLYGIYAPLVGSLNGRRRFLDQAGLDVGYGLLRTIGMGVGAFALLRLGGSGTLGATIGFVSAAALIVPIAITRSGVGRLGAAGPSARDYLGFLGPLALGQIALNLLLQTDFLLLSRFVGREASRLGLAATASDDLLGIYRGVQLFSFLPYQLLMSVSFVLFPMLAKARAEKSEPLVAEYTRAGVRIALVVTGAVSGTIAALAPHVLRFAYKSSAIWEHGGPVLRVLALGMGSFAILGISSAALTGLGRERMSAAFNALAVCLVALGCVGVTPRLPFGPPMLLATAISTSVALGLVAVVAALALRREAGAFVAPLSLVRVLVAAAVTVAVGMRLPWLGKPAVLAQGLVTGALYLSVLVVTGELGKKDLSLVRKVLGKA
ncbi:lipopolysaccharide biosynthesis protein [Polyangium fumosum]|uniref:Lipopolysaccharide biosynthesis protein n=1 Tax=Polyangium fumosum TaxID=889272 RepID=A0A4U1J0V3_9BACT|nr:lipopolysaccharide biosynthesis protein [Polyangium fumosum]TKD01069.1 lipopolysaccharide biosynthesis protein [Polyangium fumosum]